ncbi:MAG: stage II sporulation protein D [Oscillospiraceae bacterium]|nr:stage II sporulation protein D [Oscillospiraceae bacterium]
MRSPFLTGLALSLAVVLLSLAALGEGTAAKPDLPTLPAVPTPAPAPTPSAPARGERDRAQTLRVLQKDGTVESMTMADYLWRVAAAEMPASFEPDALRAQAVCARTYALWKLNAKSHQEEGADICADSSCCQAYISPDAAAQKWGANAEAYSQKIAGAVADTDAQILTYNGAPIQAVFFSSAAGSTAGAEEVWGRALPYLVPVDSPEGDEVPNYRSTVTLTAEEVKALAKEAGLGCDLSVEPSGWVTDVVRTDSGRVASLKLGGAELSGGAARSLFSLRSAAFEVSEAEGAFTFSVTGYGHGVGMSQYGANALAKQGKGWREILAHYYTGAELQDAWYSQHT